MHSMLFPEKKRTNECSAPSREQQLRVIHSMMTHPHFILVHHQFTWVGGGWHGVGREGPKLLPKWPLSPAGFKWILHHRSSLWLCQALSCFKAGARVWCQADQNHQTHGLLEAGFKLVARQQLLETTPALGLQSAPSSAPPHKVRACGLDFSNLFKETTLSSDQAEHTRFISPCRQP